MPDTRVNRGWFHVVLLIFSTFTVRALDTRESNSTLTVPEEPAVFGYQTVNAFGNLTFSSPVAVVSAPGETNRIYIVEKRGVIQVITNLAAPTKSVFLDINVPVIDSGEEGLLGLLQEGQ